MKKHLLRYVQLTLDFSEKHKKPLGECAMLQAEAAAIVGDIEKKDILRFKKMIMSYISDLIWNNL